MEKLYCLEIYMTMEKGGGSDFGIVYPKTIIVNVLLNNRMYKKNNNEEESGCRVNKNESNDKLRMD